MGQGLGGERRSTARCTCTRDVTAVFPWLTYALLSDPRIHKKPRRLYDAREAAVANLQKEIDKRKKKLLATVEFDLPTKAKAKSQGAEGEGRQAAEEEGLEESLTASPFAGCSVNESMRSKIAERLEARVRSAYS